MKRYEVLTRSWINGAIVEGGGIVELPDDFKPGPNLREYVEPPKAEEPGPQPPLPEGGGA